jgi:adenylate cyclase
VEIAATTFANVLEHNAIRPLAPAWELLLLAIWGLLLALAMRRTPGGWIPVVAFAIGGVYLTGAFIVFAGFNLWVPSVTPLLIQLPVATFGGILWRYRDMQRERENIRRAFGMHLPLSVVDQLARGIDDFTASTEHAFGICLVTDAEQYTTLAERLEPAALKKLMNAYFGALFPPVRKHGGVVADVIGDSMHAVWASGEEKPELKRRACAAALDVLAAVDAFNARNPEYRLPTRLGIHCGELVLGYVGAADHYEFRAVGDIVSTASRIEALSKQLGTRLLVSDTVAAGVSGFHLRELGRFLLKGKTRPLAICELIGTRDSVTGIQEAMCATFADALTAFTAGKWSQALRYFEAIEREHGRDGPSRFYLELCRRYVAHPPSADWSGIVELQSK